jgi:hypothetical protein
MDIHLAIIKALAEKMGIPMLRDRRTKEFLELRQRARDEIVQAFGIPAHLCRKRGGVTVEVPGKTYLGDSVYCEVDGWGGLVLTTENGLSTDPSNRIVLEPEVYDALVMYHDRVMKV